MQTKETTSLNLLERVSTRRARPRVALIGCGRIGLVHARTLAEMRDLCDFALIVDNVEDTAKNLATSLDVPGWSVDVDDALTSPLIDAVIIASPTETHTPYIVQAASHGKDIFSEKPIALDLETTEQALQAVAAAGVRFQIGFQRRFDTGYMAAKAAIISGELGAVEMIRDAMRDPEPPPADYIARSGGLYRDMTVHNFDSVRWLMGENPVTLYAAASTLISEDFRSVNDVDTSVVTLQFRSGALATIENCRRSNFGYDVRTEIFGAQGAIMVGDSRETPVRRYTASGVKEDHQYFFLNRFRNAYRQELIAFFEAILNDREPLVTGADGRAALQLAYAAEHSLWDGRPVSLSPDLEVLDAKP